MTSDGTRKFRFEATGSVAHARIAPLLSSDWVDTAAQGETEDGMSIPDFLWENTQMMRTKKYRDEVKAYSHLPNGTNILDSKWVLGRVFSSFAKQSSSSETNDEDDDDDPLLETLETHCFRGIDGFQRFCKNVNLFETAVEMTDEESNANDTTKYPDILDNENPDLSNPLPKAPRNFWVLKDAMSNGAGGVWVVGPKNAESFITKETTPLYPEHAYVAQRYVWPPVLFGGRKCHVRVYGLLTSDGKAFVHKRAFLHVANDIFNTSDGGTTGNFQDSVHITNCCANSHDDSKFAGEILSDFEENVTTERDGQQVIPLAEFFPSIKSCIAALAKKTFPFLQGGRANGGFEYMGIDFMLSYNEDKQPVAYILEVNAPPSQDTATGLPHAENLHDSVIRDLITLWVIPRVSGSDPKDGGWRCVYDEQLPPLEQGASSLIIPSKAAIINKIRWAMFEKKASRAAKAAEQQEEAKAAAKTSENGTQETKSKPVPLDVAECENIVAFARSQFPYFSDSQNNPTTQHSSSSNRQVFFENAGGSQVAQPVIDAVVASLSFRHREVVGDKTKTSARETLRRLLGATSQDPIFVGPNASSLLANLARKYVEFGLLTSSDEIIVSTESHLANFDPWLKAAKTCGATIKYWAPFSQTTLPGNISRNLEDLITTKTRLVAIPHASNILGQVRDIRKLSTLAKEQSFGHAHVVVDGVASAPHWFSDVDRSMADWYVVSCHKLFSSHIGGLYGRRSGPVELFLSAAGLSSGSDETLYKQMEPGTANYEACAGVIGLGHYFSSLSQFASKSGDESIVSVSRSVSSGENCAETGGKLAPVGFGTVCRENVEQAYRCIRNAESPLVEALLHGLRRSRKVRIIQGDPNVLDAVARLSIASFVHEDIAVKQLASFCEQQGFTCRVSSFLCTEYLSNDLGFDYAEGILRVSLAHYNSVQEVNSLLRSLESFPGWF